jgi:superfamily I DNA/RNA helicase
MGLIEAPPRKRLNGTPQQEAFFARLGEAEDNIVLEARAGTGKSSSCAEGMNRLVEGGFPSPEIRYTAFNKSIADEFRHKAPPGSDVGTFHSFAFAALRSAIGSPAVEASKSFMILDELAATSPGPALKTYLRRSVVKLVSGAKNAAYDPEAPSRERFALLDQLVNDLDLEVWGQADAVTDWAERVLSRSIERTDVVDYDDMLWLALRLGVSFPSCGVLFVDECQDLNPVQHALLPRLNPSGRTVAVGDRYQSIYGFRGADVHSIPRLIEGLGATVLPLTVTFRCPKSHVLMAQQWVSDFEAHESNDVGHVEETGAEGLYSANPGDQVLCRRNAPLVQAALEAIGAGRPAYIRGRGFGEALRPVVKRCDAPTIGAFLANVARWHNGKLAELSQREGSEDAIERVTDQAMALDAIAGSVESVSQIDPAITRLFDETSLQERITFSSVHRAKGTEARRVYLIDEGERAPKNKRRRQPSPDELQQQRNVSYVAHTRSLHTFVRVVAE